MPYKINTDNLQADSILSGLLVEHKISESELSRITDIPRATINRLTSGKTTDPRISTLKAIADHFDITIDQLISKKNANVYNIPLNNLEVNKIKNIIKRNDFILEIKLGKARGTMDIHIEGELSSEDAMRLITVVRAMIGEM